MGISPLFMSWLTPLRRSTLDCVLGVDWHGLAMKLKLQRGSFLGLVGHDRVSCYARFSDGLG